MCDKYQTPKLKNYKTPRADYATEGCESDDSINSQHSARSTNTEASENGELSLQCEFDEVIRLCKMQRQADVEDAMLEMVQQMKELRNNLVMTHNECHRLQMIVDERTHSLSDIEGKLNLARKMVDAEKRRSKCLHDENEELRGQIHKVKEFLFRDNRGVLNREANEKLAFLHNEHDFDTNLSYGNQLGAIPEINTTGSLLADFSYSRSEDDLDTSICAGRNWKKPRHSAGPEPPVKKRRSSTHQRVVEINQSDSVRATTTLTVPKHGPITATSIIEAVPPQNDNSPEPQGPQTSYPPESNIIFDIWQNNGHQEQRAPVRQHCLQSKTVVLPDTCISCEKKLRFGKTALKCKDCRATCHPECQKDLPLPCIPFVNTPTRNLLGLISDFTPTSAPMVPALIVHCVNEIEQRGLRELGIYRIPGSERDVKQLKEKFLRGKGSPNLRDIDVHILCGTVKDFLRYLHEPLVTFNLWPRFVRCVEEDNENTTATLYRLISELPQPNRDTLAYMMLHLRTVAEAPECKMPISNLAKVFGPTIVGYSSSNPSADNLLTETRQQNMVMEAVMNLPTEYWSSFVNLCETQATPRLQQTPSTDSLLRPTSRNIFTPHALKSAKRKHRIFNTPPSYRHN